jgi:hypothetical protein
MQISTSKIVDEEQFSLPGKTDSGISIRPELRRPEIKEIREKIRSGGCISCFISTVERLELLLEQETAALGENKLITLDDFNQKKSPGLLELRRTIRPIRDLHLENFGLDPKPVIARLRGRLQSNLTVLQTHLDAVAAIAAIIARTIEEQESDGTYTPEHTHKARQR